ELRRPRSRPVHHAADRRPSRRRDLGREQGRIGHHVLLLDAGCSGSGRCSGAAARARTGTSRRLTNNRPGTFVLAANLMARVLLFLFLAANAYADDLRIDYTRESLTGTHVHYQQYLNGIRVVGGDRVETITRDGKRQTLDHLALPPRSTLSATPQAPVGGEIVYLNMDGNA